MNITTQTPIIATWHTDPGHGWLLVREAWLHQVGLTDMDFSPFSYRHFDHIKRGEAAPGIQWFALEEDLDAQIFLRAAKQRGITVITQTPLQKNEPHYIRDWQPINPRTWQQWKLIRDDIVGRYAQH